MSILEFYKNKRVFITGHTGFKGTWLTQILLKSGAIVTGFALKPNSEMSLFELTNIESRIFSNISDIRDIKSLKQAFDQASPEIVFHLAAQPIVRESYRNPIETYDVNVMGTVNILECIRLTDSVRSFVNITTDKVYENREWHWGYRENENLCGQDPYSNSKSCSELVTYSYKSSFFQNDNLPAISTARSGNVIGGGDYAIDRIIPDCIRSAERRKKIYVRNPYSIRPYQHVLDCLYGYLLLAQLQYEKPNLAGNYNFGPDDSSCVTTANLVNIFCDLWESNQEWETRWDDGPHEATYLKLDCSKSKNLLGWRPIWPIRTAVEKTIEFNLNVSRGVKAEVIMDKQINEYFESIK